jgi:AmmeMemoRadiSam system protein B
MTTRAPVAAGLFYPASAPELARLVDALLADAAPADAGELGEVRGLVAPHAGYAYSGRVAASAFSLAPVVARVLLLGPSHFVPLEGMAVSSAHAWETPLGAVTVARDLRDAALAAGAVLNDVPHRLDHALEVELPFLQHRCSELEILPVAVGRTSATAVADLVEALDAFVVVSSDLSHYLDERSAQRIDRETADAVVARRPEAIRSDRACGVHALRGLVEHARRRDLALELLDLRTSADASGDTGNVVGYGAFALRGVE